MADSSFNFQDILNGGATGDPITYFAETDARGHRVPFGIKKEDRSRHMYVIGKTGMGKSTLLENMAIQDILRGEGLAFIDPHGSTAEKLLEYVPEERVNDVLYFAPFDLQYPISFNVLEDVDEDKRHLVVAGLMNAFEKLWADQWSARMAYILQNTLGALLEFPGATILGVNRMYIDKDYRKQVISHITDPSVRSFWVDEYTKYTDRYTQEATPAIQNKIGQFASNALVRNIIGQPQSAFNIRELMDSKKIFIVNLSKGRVGEGNANLLGSMLITKLYLAAMSRADATPQALAKLPDFYLHVDEFQNFANKSFADILSEARKYKLALTIAHQYIEQMEEEVQAAVFGNVGTMVAFRVGAFDAEVLEKEFSPTFVIEDIVNLAARQIYLKLMIDGVSSRPFSATTLAPIPAPRVSHRDRAIAFSRKNYARPRSEVDADVRAWVGYNFEDVKDKERSAGRDGAGRDSRGYEGSRREGGGRESSSRERGSDRPREREVAPRERFSSRQEDRSPMTERVSTTARSAPYEGRSEGRYPRESRPRFESGRNALQPTPRPIRDPSPIYAPRVDELKERVLYENAPRITPSTNTRQSYATASRPASSASSAGTAPQSGESLRAVLEKMAKSTPPPTTQKTVAPKPDPKVASEEDRSELRALVQGLAKRGADEQVAVKTNTDKNTSTHSPSPTPHARFNGTPKQEVPEEVLRKLLKVDQ